MYMAVALDRFIEIINGYLDTIGEKGEITKEDVKTCIKYDDTVKIMDVNGKEVMWLWYGWRLHDLMHRVAKVATEEGEVAAAVV
jgi:2',3'-cyclic-nucleotide 2'-phosphodiesterase (5'-nucleotidase family)